MIDPTDYGYRRLALGILKIACKDCQADDPALAAEARHWLTNVGAAWAVELDLDGERVTGWVAGLEALPWEQLALGI